MLVKQDIVKQLKELGVNQGMIIEIHVKLESMGLIVGGAQTFVDALIECVGYNGTILLPLFFQDSSEPSYWTNPSLEPRSINEVRSNLPISNKKESETYIYQEIASNLRKRDGIVISAHPVIPYIAWGKYAKLLCNHHSLNFPLSTESPAARLIELKGSILLIGENYDNASALHLAEYYSETRPIIIKGAMVQSEGYRKFQSYLDIEYGSQTFNAVGKALEQKGFVKKGLVGNEVAKLFVASVANEYIIKYLKQDTLTKYYKGV